MTKPVDNGPLRVVNERLAALETRVDELAKRCSDAPAPRTPDAALAHTEHRVEAAELHVPVRDERAELAGPQTRAATGIAPGDWVFACPDVGGDWVYGVVQSLDHKVVVVLAYKAGQPNYVVTARNRPELVVVAREGLGR